MNGLVTMTESFLVLDVKGPGCHRAKDGCCKLSHCEDRTDLDTVMSRIGVMRRNSNAENSKSSHLTTRTTYPNDLL